MCVCASVRACVCVQEGRWNDSPCNQTLPSICKKAAQKTDGQAQDHGCKPVRFTVVPFFISRFLHSLFPSLFVSPLFPLSCSLSFSLPPPSLSTFFLSLLLSISLSLSHSFLSLPLSLVCLLKANNSICYSPPVSIVSFSFSNLSLPAILYLFPLISVSVPLAVCLETFCSQF